MPYIVYDAFYSDLKFHFRWQVIELWKGMSKWLV